MPKGLAARLAAELAPRVPRCPQCALMIGSPLPGQLYCSPRCRKGAQLGRYFARNPRARVRFR